MGFWEIGGMVLLIIGGFYFAYRQALSVVSTNKNSVPIARELVEPDRYFWRHHPCGFVMEAANRKPVCTCPNPNCQSPFQRSAWYNVG